MNIRFKLLVIVTLTIVLSITLIYYAISSIMLKSYLDIESKYMDSKIEGVTRMITHMCEEFSTKMSDWAMWDDTYNFMSDRNAQYIESNINYESMRSLDIDFILFANGSEEIILDCFFDHKNGKISASPDSLKNSLIHISRRLLSKTKKTEIARLVSLESKPAIVSSDIILKTGGRGTANGFLIYGRFIDEAEISKLNKMTALNLGFNEIIDCRLDESQKVSAAADVLKYSLHKSLNNDFITCHLIFNDFNDKPLFILNFKEPRTIYGQAVIALRYFVAALLITGLIFFIMTSYLIDKFIADRIIKLSSEVKKLSVEGNYQKRLSFNGNDEIASLSSEINGLLDNIEGANREMKKLLSDLDIATRAKSDFIGSIGHELRTPITCIIGYTDILEDTMPEGEAREFVNRIKLSSHILISTVNDILDYTSIEG
ncbi:MAG TPA: CHASE4 domain-containing protein, partial [Candidatus Wallbacteria bacterium]|nr:CHASE4 domain-containing protein [Candidatus Wallbacteria bacterium]